MIKFIVFLVSIFSYSQSTDIVVISSFDKSPIKNVLIYNETKLIGETNEVGYLKVADAFQTIKFVKENFEDTELTIFQLNELKNTVSLNPILAIKLDTVLVQNIKVNATLLIDKIKQARVKQNFKPDNYFQSKVSFECSGKTLFYFNNIIYPSKGLKVNDLNKIIYHGNRIEKENNVFIEVFNVNQSECILPIKTSVYCGLGDYSISSIFDDKLYNYSIEKSENFYILHFTPKNNKPKLLYEGYFIIDKSDYGILELNMNLFGSENNIWKSNSMATTNTYAYKIIEDSFKFKFLKTGTDYFLESSFRKMKCLQLKGNNINEEFSFVFNNEQSIDHKGLSFKEYDYTNNKFK